MIVRFVVGALELEISSIEVLPDSYRVMDAVYQNELLQPVWMLSTSFRLLPAPRPEDIVLDSLTPQLLRRGNSTWASQELTSLYSFSRSRISSLTICQSGVNNVLNGTISTR